MFIIKVIRVLLWLVKLQIPPFFINFFPRTPWVSFSETIVTKRNVKFTYVRTKVKKMRVNSLCQCQRPLVKVSDSLCTLQDFLCSAGCPSSALTSSGHSSVHPSPIRSRFNHSKPKKARLFLQTKIILLNSQTFC